MARVGGDGRRKDGSAGVIEGEARRRLDERDPTWRRRRYPKDGRVGIVRLARGALGNGRRGVVWDGATAATEAASGGAVAARMVGKEHVVR